MIAVADGSAISLDMRNAPSASGVIANLGGGGTILLAKPIRADTTSVLLSSTSAINVQLSGCIVVAVSSERVLLLID